MFAIKQAAAYLGVGDSTLRRYHRSGKLIPKRTFGGHRRYSQDQMNEHLGIGTDETPLDSSITKRVPYLYARVSSERQAKIGSLDRQTERLIKYCKKLFGRYLHRSFDAFRKHFLVLYFSPIQCPHNSVG
jgi:putative resolvase